MHARPRRARPQAGEPMSEHLDETGQPCTRHANVDEHALLRARDARLADAGVSSRCRVEAAEPDDGARRDQRARGDRAATAHARSTPRTRRCASSTRSSRRTARSRRRRSAARIACRSSSQRAAERTACACAATIRPRSPRRGRRRCAHALALLLDLAAGPGHLGRVVDVTCTVNGDRVRAGDERTAGSGGEAADERRRVARDRDVRHRARAGRRCAVAPTGFVVRVPAAIRRRAEPLRSRERALRRRSARRHRDELGELGLAIVTGELRIDRLLDRARAAPATARRPAARACTRASGAPRR